MTVISVVLAIAIVLALLAVGLMGWAYFNPKWQRADAYDALIPFSLGVMLMVAAILLALVAAALRLFVGSGT